MAMVFSELTTNVGSSSSLTAWPSPHGSVNPRDQGVAELLEEQPVHLCAGGRRGYVAALFCQLWTELVASLGYERHSHRWRASCKPIALTLPPLTSIVEPLYGREILSWLERQRWS